MFIKGRAPRTPPRQPPSAQRGGRRRVVVATPPALGSTSRPHFRRGSGCRHRSDRRFAASRKMAAAAINGAVGSSTSGPSAASGAILQAAAGMYEQLKGEWNRKSPNLSKCGEELGRLKVGADSGRYDGSRLAEIAVPSGPRRAGGSSRVKSSEQPKLGLGVVKEVRGTWNGPNVAPWCRVAG